MSWAILLASFAFNRRSSESSKPRSANTLPLLDSIFALFRPAGFDFADLRVALISYFLSLPGAPCNRLMILDYFENAQVYLRLPPPFALDHANLHDAGMLTTVGVSFSGVKLFLVSSALKSTRSAL